MGEPARPLCRSRIEAAPGGRVLFEMVYDLPAPVERVWPILSDTERLNRRVGLPPTRFAAVGGEPVAVRRVSARLGAIPLEWVEDPFEFVEHHHYWVRRRMRGGPIREFNGGMFFHETPGGTRVEVRSDFLPANAAGRLLVRAMCRKTLGEFEHAVAGILRHLAGAEWPPYGEGVDLVSPGQREATLARLRGCSAELRSHRLAAKLFDYLASAGDVQLAAIRPFYLARVWGEERREVLQLCLRAAREGVLDLYWDLLCPNCRGTSESWSRLEDVREKSHCESCQISFNANFDRQVEVTFRPNRSYRFVDVAVFCSGGPQTTPHVVLQWVLPPGEAVDLEPSPPPGRYRLRDLPAGRAAELFVDADEGDAELRAVLGESHLEVSGATLKAGKLRVRLENRTTQRQQFVLERLTSHEEAATAAAVTVYQEFRDLFGSQVLSPGVRLGIQTLPLLFTDLKGSTRLYQELGDAAAYALVRDHFELLQRLVGEHGGGVVKTIGDAVMAAFPTAEDAVACALRIQAALQPFNQGRPADLRLKMGIHQGPCIAVRSYDDHLDYFGSSVNLAARTHTVSSGEDLVLTESVLADPRVQELLRGLRLERFTADLRGIGEVSLGRVTRET